jgi:murein DD-endopeptidase MepM/ murein hydrolase activator NlpD
MTQSVGSIAHVFAAGLALVAGYGAAAIAGPGRAAGATAGSFADFDKPLSAKAVETTLFVRGQLLRPVRSGRGPLRGGAIGDLDFRDHQLASLAWAPAPAVPRMLSARDAAGGSQDEGAGPVPVLVAALPEPMAMAEPRIADFQPRLPVLASLVERMGAQGLGAQLLEDSPLFGARRKRSEPARLPMSRTQSMAHAYSHAGDPLAALKLDDDARPAPEFIMPFANGRITSLFNQGRVHPAIDLAGKLGSPVMATTSRQKVSFAGPRGGYGNAVITIDAIGRTHLYGHLQKITSHVGQMLSQGDKLGHLGSTGHSTGPHVHYEVRNPKGVHINPVTLLFPGRGVSTGYAWADVQQENVLARLASARAR